MSSRSRMPIRTVPCCVRSKRCQLKNRQIYVARLAREGIEKERNNNNPDEINFLIEPVAGMKIRY